MNNLEEHQDIVSKQSHEHRPPTSDNNEVRRDSETTHLQTE